jgi:hypothetical protein
MHTWRVSRLATLLAAMAVVAAPVLAQHIVGREGARGELVASSQGVRSVTYNVTITNVSPQIFSAPIVVVHSDAVALYTPGQPASPELAAEAEDADASGLMSMLQSLEGDGVDSYAMADANLMPGESVTLQVTSQGFFKRITTLAMLVTTNDGFMASTTPIQTLALGGNPFDDNVIHVAASAWDAGSEANTEDCAFIPGPPCGSHGVRDPDGAEGFVRIHSGIHGIGDLNAAALDWRNPVALISISRAN